MYLTKMVSENLKFLVCVELGFYLFSIISSSKYGLVASEMVSGSWSSDHAIDLRMDLPDLDSYRNLTSSSSSTLSRKKANFNFFDRSDFDFLKLIRNFFWFEIIFFFSKVGRGRIHHQLNIISHIVSLNKKYQKHWPAC